MSKRKPSTEIDKQLQETFSAYIVDPMHNDLEGQLENLQKKWLGKQEFDEDTPYLETFMDDRLRQIKDKLVKQEGTTNTKFSEVTSLLESISDDTDQIEQIADTAASVSETIWSVQGNLGEIKNSLTALDDYVKQNTKILKENAAANTRSVLEAISATEEKCKATADGLEQALVQVVDTLSHDAEQEKADLKANAAQETKKVLDAISASEKSVAASAQAATDKLEQRLSDAVDELSHRMEQDHTAQQEQLEEIWIRSGALEEEFGSEQKKLRRMLYLSLALNSVTLIGLAATILILLLGT